MIGQSSSQDLQLKIPLLSGKIPNEDIELLNFKWGGVDGHFHSAKGVARNIDTKKTLDEIRSTEITAVDMIDNELLQIFSCPRCKTDLRKCGLHKVANGNQISEAYLASDGSIARIGKTHFSKTGKPDVEFHCLSCSSKIPKDSPTGIFIGKRMNSEIILYYVMNVLKKKVLASVSGNVSTNNVYEGKGPYDPEGEVSAGPYPSNVNIIPTPDQVRRALSAENIRRAVSAPRAVSEPRSE